MPNDAREKPMEEPDADPFAQYAARFAFNKREGGERGRFDDRARRELKDRAAEIVSSFRGEPNRRLSNGKTLAWGRKGSFVLNIAGNKAGLWYDHENEIGGDIIAFIANERGCSTADAIAYVLESLLGPTSRSWTSATVRAPAPEPDDARRTERALSIWSEALPLCGTLAEVYLNNRGIDVPDEALNVLGLHRCCPFEARRAPALLALVEDIVTGEPVAIHRRELTQHATAAGPAKALGPIAGGAIKLAHPLNHALAIGEGIETCLSGMQLGFGPAWSVISAGGLKGFPVLDYIERLIILVDHDDAGRRAAAECRARWEAAGKHVRLVMPDTPGHDINDVLRSQESGNA